MGVWGKLGPHAITPTRHHTITPTRHHPIMPDIPLIERAPSFGDATAIVDDTGTYSYEHLRNVSQKGAGNLLNDFD